MPVTSLTLAKAHLAIDGDHDDELLTHYLGAAEAWVAAYTGSPFTGHPLETQAALMLAAHSYETREAVSFSHPYATPYGIADLLSPLKERVVGYVPAPEPGATP